MELELFGLGALELAIGGAGLLVVLLLVVLLIVRLSRGRRGRGSSMHDKARMELAQEALALAREAEAAINWARARDRKASEGKGRKLGSRGEDVPTKARRNVIYAAVGRIEQKSALFDKLIDVRGRFGVMFGERPARPLDLLITMKNLLIAHTEALLRLDVQYHGNTTKEPVKRRKLEVTCGLRDDDSGIDPVGHKMSEAVRGLELFIRHLKKL